MVWIFSFGRIHRTYEKLWEANEVERAIFVGFHYEDVEKEEQNFILKEQNSTNCKMYGE